MAQPGPLSARNLRALILNRREADDERISPCQSVLSCHHPCLFLVGGFGGRFGEYGYGYGHDGIASVKLTKGWIVQPLYPRGVLWRFDIRLSRTL